MDSSQFVLILVAEALAVSVFVAAVVLLKFRRLLSQVKKLRERISELTAQQRPQAPTKPQSYSDTLDQQMALTVDYHASLGTGHDIALDLDPDTPLPRRTAALRYAFLTAEKRAATKGKINWDFLSSQYQQLLAPPEISQPPETTDQEEEIRLLKGELEQTRKRIHNLERFKSLYLELEERWDRCQDKASERYRELQNMADKVSDKEEFQRLLEHYHNTYSDIGALIGQGYDDLVAATPADDPQEHLQEIQRLRHVAADQHRIITQLQFQLQTANSKEERVQVVTYLQTELQKQARFLQESETCIRLMEDELATSKAEIRHLKEKQEQAARLRVELEALQSAADLHEQVVDTLKQENRLLAKKLKQLQEAPPEDNPEVRILRKELTHLQSKYNDLEEKFLNLKLRE
jgi:DNA repair exonuclease SbcCD ATPase subunit